MCSLQKYLKRIGKFDYVTNSFLSPLKRNIKELVKFCFQIMVKLLLTKVTVNILSNFANKIFTNKASWKIIWVKVSKFIDIEYSKNGTFSLTDFTLLSMYLTEFYFLNIILQGWIDLRTNFLPIKQFCQSKKWDPSEQANVLKFLTEIKGGLSLHFVVKKANLLQCYRIKYVQIRNFRALFLSNHENLLQAYLTFLTIK